jgi:hypothetical protein
MDDGFLVVELGLDCQQSGYNLLSPNTPQEVNASCEHHTLFRYCDVTTLCIWHMNVGLKFGI